MDWPNSPPEVDVGGDLTVDEGATGTLSVRVTDADGDDVDVRWIVQDGHAAPGFRIHDTGSRITTFSAPLVGGDARVPILLYACDGIHTGVGNDLLYVTIRDISNPPPPNRLPVPDGGADFTVTEGETGVLRGTATDQDGDRLTYEWLQFGPVHLALDDASSASTGFTAPQVDEDTTVTIIFQVWDGEAHNNDKVVVTILDSGG